MKTRTFDVQEEMATKNYENGQPVILSLVYGTIEIKKHRRKKMWLGGAL
jgi:hypothetical protein